VVGNGPAVRIRPGRRNLAAFALKAWTSYTFFAKLMQSVPPRDERLILSSSAALPSSSNVASTCIQRCVRARERRSGTEWTLRRQMDADPTDGGKDKRDENPAEHRTRIIATLAVKVHGETLARTLKRPQGTIAACPEAHGRTSRRSRA
jgi:hypothetical protein